VMTKDEFERQWKHKKDAVTNAQGQVRVAQQAEREFITAHGLEILGLSKGDVLIGDHGRRYAVTGAFLNEFGRVSPLALVIKKSGDIGTAKMPTWHGCWTVEKKATPE